MIISGIRNFIPSPLISTGTLEKRDEFLPGTAEIKPAQHESFTPHIQSPPFQFRLQLQIRSIPINNTSTTAHYTHGNIVCKPINLYQDPAITTEREHELYLYGRCQAIELIYNGSSTVQMTPTTPWLPFNGSQVADGLLSCAAQNCLYRHEFLTQTQPQILQRTYQDASKRWVTFPLEIPGVPLFGFGGFYRPGTPLDRIEQVYFTLLNKSNVTHLNLTTASDWHQKGINIMLGGLKDQAYYKLYSDKPCPMSLATLLHTGGLQIEWRLVPSIVFVYHSERFTYAPPSGIDVTFTLRKLK
jgi:hypothetical protein